MKFFAVALGLSFAGHVAGTESPVAKVVSLLQQMKDQVEKDAKADEEAYDKYNCWCGTNQGLKTEAVEIAEKRIIQVEAFLEEAAGTEAQLKTEISSLEEGIAADQEALRTATSLREQESEEFRAAEADSKESVSALKEAVTILEKVQLLQRIKGHASHHDVKPLLMQVRNVVEGVHAKHGGFQDVMRRDLWDVMSTIDDMSGAADSPSTDFLSVRGRKVSALERQGMLSTGEEPPNGLQGNAAGASSYNARSGGILGMLSEMKDEFIKNLVMSQKEELESMISFQGLRAAKVGEIASATEAAEQKESALADLQSKAAQAKEDLETTKEALGVDQQFLLGLEKNCKSNEEDYAERSKIRSEELVALAETITILSEDDARDLFGKTMSLLQTGTLTDAARNQAIDKAMKHILTVARKHGNWILASLAVHVRLDTFTKVIEAIDKMSAELKAQQQAEFEKKDYCTQEIDQTEDGITKKSHTKEDLEGKALGLENGIAALASELEVLHKEVADTQVSLKQAGEDRKAENLVFQQSIGDQRATINVLAKAKDRLAQFYSKSSAALAQVAGKRQEPSNEPGAAVAPPPPKPAEYRKSGGGGGALQLLDKIMQDATADEAELLKTEQSAQASYTSLVKEINVAITVDQGAIVDKTKLMEEATADKSEAAGALLANQEELTKLDETLNSYHLDCDWLLKYFDVRQTARAEELEAIAQAKAVLSGADFGKEVAAEQ
eukprot:CAMPEP_0183399260 /NCGR_PEP_ID=MMETSP0370-20130417/11814_1 /TAXON_ID=268820 /ORGANISM="Peridinium aciculiferum, Strain PAER-2" /LENGTH=727 /DNA_ID=CAMNT_0025580385 /DNA_START=54 /DNA_END=2237 /DNA_ORIENTATION=-